MPNWPVAGRSRPVLLLRPAVGVPTCGAGRLRRQLLPFLLLLPALVLVGLVLGYPIGQVVATSFQQLGVFQLLSHQTVWNGLSNYTALFSSSQFLDVLQQTLFFVVATVGLTMLIGTGVALLMGRLGKFLRTVVSVAMLLAWAMPNTAASIVWTWLFETQYGVVNYLLVTLGLRASTTMTGLLARCPPTALLRP